MHRLIKFLRNVGLIFLRGVTIESAEKYISLSQEYENSNQLLAGQLRDTAAQLNDCAAQLNDYAIVFNHAIKCREIYVGTVRFVPDENRLDVDP